MYTLSIEFILSVLTVKFSALLSTISIHDFLQKQINKATKLSKHSQDSLQWMA